LEAFPEFARRVGVEGRGSQQQFEVEEKIGEERGDEMVGQASRGVIDIDDL
jgi:hypothetical protein